MKVIVIVEICEKEWIEMRTIAVINTKAGQGKTLITSTFAQNLAEDGYRVIVLDMDPKGDLSKQLGVSLNEIGEGKTLASLLDIELRNRSNYESDFLDYNPADAVIHTDNKVDLLTIGADLYRFNDRVPNAITGDSIIKDILNRINNSYDFAIIDTESKGIDRLLVNCIVGADSVIVPSSCADDESLNSLRSLLNVLVRISRIANPRLVFDGILFTNVKEGDKTSRMLRDIARMVLNVNIYKAYLPAEASTAIDNNISFNLGKNDTGSKVYQEFLSNQLNYQQL